MSPIENHLKVALSQAIAWIPILLIVLFIFLVPPVAIAIILAFFASPLVTILHSSTKIPLTLCTILIMMILALFLTAFLFFSVLGLVEFALIIKRHAASLTINHVFVKESVDFLEVKILEMSSTLLKQLLMLIQSLFQQMIHFFIFLLSFFFALRECGRNRFWFLNFFPTSMRTHVKKVFVTAGTLLSSFVYIEIRLLFLTFILLVICFFFLRFESPITMGFLISLVDSFPFLGIGVFIIPMAAYFYYRNDYLTGSVLVVVYIAVLLIRQFAESYLWASMFTLKPVYTFLIIASTIYAFGIIGVIFTPFLLFIASKIKNHALFTE